MRSITRTPSSIFTAAVMAEPGSLDGRTEILPQEHGTAPRCPGPCARRRRIIGALLHGWKTMTAILPAPYPFHGLRARLAAGAVATAAACIALSLAPGIAGAAVPAGTADAASFPSRPIRMVVPYVPGGLPDTLGRIVAQRMGDAFRSPVLVDNRPGAGGIIGTELVARALPDGYTLLVADLGQTAITPAMTPKLPYDIKRDFAP
ncbi:MAG: Bug family tripartite tricarboxylate transporter substrate binding protein, partial [bacterium]